jgi:hypothetical protein
MTDRYDELRAAAEAATPGPWRQSRTRRFIGNGYGAPWVCEVDEGTDYFGANSDFIALANPETINAILSECDALAERVRVLEGALSSIITATEQPHFLIGYGTHIEEVANNARSALAPSPLVEGGR